MSVFACVHMNVVENDASMTVIKSDISRGAIYFMVGTGLVQFITIKTLSYFQSRQEHQCYEMTKYISPLHWTQYEIKRTRHSIEIE